MDDRTRGLYRKFVIEGATESARFFVIDLDHDKHAPPGLLSNTDANGFTVERSDGESEPGQKHHGCRYCLIDPREPMAPAVLSAYADSCASEYPQLAADLRAFLRGERGMP